MKIAVLDIGGTAIKSGIFESITGRLTNKAETPSESQQGGARIMEIAQSIVARHSGFDAIGISTSGQVDSEQGIIRYAGDTIPDYTGTEVRRIFNEKFGVPVFVGNDVNAAATGEAAFGAGKGKGDFLCLTYGTGVGGAIVHDGKVFTGSSFSAGEFGVMVTHAHNPKSIYYQDHASASVLVQRAHAIMPQITNGKQVFENLTNPKIKSAVDSWIGDILCGLASLIHVFNPSLMVLGGGIMQAEYIIPAIRARLNDYVVPGMQDVIIAPAELGNDAGLWGMGHIASQNYSGLNSKPSCML